MNNNKGFSLVEILVVIAIIGTMVLIGAPAITSKIAHQRLVRATRDMTVELNAARLKAVTRNTAYKIEFTLGATDSYRLWRDNGGWEVDPDRIQQDLEPTVNISSPNANFYVTFNANGTSTFNGASANTDICVQNTADAGDRMKITVDRNIGKITVVTGC